jgi:hypothetical protein
VGHFESGTFLEGDVLYVHRINSTLILLAALATGDTGTL